MKNLQIIGNVGYDAQLREYNGKKFVSFTVAVNEKFTDNNGQKVERTDWFNITTYQTSLAEYLRKGTKVFAQGNPSVRPYQNREGEWNASFNMHAKYIQLLGSVNNADNAESTDQ